MNSKITFIQDPKPPSTRTVSSILIGTAFTGTLTLDSYTRTGVFLKQGRTLVGLGGNEPGEKDDDNPGNVFFDIDKGTVTDYVQVDLVVKAVPHVS